MISIIVIFLISFSLSSPEEKEHIVFHITLADPNLYINGVYTDKFTIDKGEYFFRFVPNGSSPEILSIMINGENFNFSENFRLQSISQGTEISEYFTWEYNGEQTILISQTQEISIIINPNGNVLGSVSVDILK